MVAEVLKRESAIRAATTEVVMLMPFILWRNIPLYHKTGLRAFEYTHPSSYHAVKWLLTRFSGLPTYYKRLALANNREWTWNSGNLRVIATRLLSPRLIDNFFAMGIDEIKLISQQDEAQMVRTFTSLAADGIALRFLYTNGDVWAPMEDTVRLQRVFKTFSNVSILKAPNVTHGFSTHKPWRDQVLQELFPPPELAKAQIQSRL